MEVQLIGEVLSKRIVKHRPFSSWAEVKTLAQIGDKRLQKLYKTTHKLFKKYDYYSLKYLKLKGKS